MPYTQPSQLSPQYGNPMSSSDILARLAKAIEKPGTNRAAVFSNESVFAYSVDSSKDIIREDVFGAKVVGVFVDGHFQSSSSSSSRS